MQRKKCCAAARNCDQKDDPSGQRDVTIQHMNQIHTSATDFLATERVGVFAIEMPDGSPHAATVHYAYDASTGTFYFETQATYRKAEALQARSHSRASLVIGTSESIMKTLQLDGLAQLIHDTERTHFEAVYFGKFPEKLQKYASGKYVCFSLTPTWWRFTDWTAAAGKIMYSSTDNT
jgi:uncharacterized protein YhbP (UPF0306 family)